MNHAEKLQQMQACREGIEYARQFPTLQAAWDACERPDWMCWLLRETVTGENGSPVHRALVRVTARCAMLAPELTGDRAQYELARQWACDAALRFGEGENNRDECAAADAAAAAAAYAAAAAAADAYAAVAVPAYAAYAASAAADAAAYAAEATEATDAAADARKQVLAECCDIIREEFPQAPQRSK